MRTFFLAATMLMWAPVAMADSIIAEQAGNWESVVDDNMFVAQTLPDASGIKLVLKPNFIVVYLKFPGRESLPGATLQFDNGLSFTMGAADHHLTTSIGADQMPQFIHALTAGKAATIFAGTERYTISLAGTSSAVDAMSFYAKEHKIPLPLPFTPGMDTALTSTAAQSDETASTIHPVSDQSSLAPSPSPAAMPVQETESGNGMPADERTLISIVDQEHSAFESAANDFAKGATRAQRGHAVCAFLTGTSNGWIGTVETLSSTSNGKGVLKIRISPHITVSTHNNSISDALSGAPSTLIDPASALSQQVASLNQGDQVKFSGQFKPSSGTDCIDEESVTQAGSMEDPEYIMVFSDVRKVSG